MFSSKDIFFGSQSSGYKVTKSLRFRASNTAYMFRTFGVPTNGKKYTISFWAKLSKLGDTAIINTGSTGATGSWVYINSSNQINFNDYCAGSRCQKITTSVYRDPSAFYHIVCALDTTVPSMKVYVNGSEVLDFGTNTAPTLNANSSLNANSAVVNIGRDTAGASYFDGYMTEYNFVDGQALTPSSFGAYDTNGVWQPITPSVSDYGKNGFYLSFADTTSTTTLGNDTAAIATNHSAANNWSTSGFSLTSGASYDSMLDSPTNYDDAGNGRGNYCTFNPLICGALTTISEGNLKGSSTTGYDIVGTLSPTVKCYYEYIITNTAAVTTPALGMGDPTIYNPWVNNFQNVNGAFGVRKDGAVYVNGVAGSTYTSFTTGDIVGFAFDPATGKFWYHVNGVWVNSGNPTAGTGQAGTATVGYNYVPLVNLGLSSAIVTLNCGQQPFRGVYVSGSGSSYTGTGAPPSGFYAINTQNLSTPTITNGAQYMAAVTYQGATAPNTVTATSTNSGNNPNAVTFQPDFVWIKARSAATDHKLTDAVRGVTKALISDTTGAETTDTNGLTAFTASGFTVGSDTNYNNTTGPVTYVAWEWLAGSAPTTDNVAGAGNVPTAGSVKIDGSNSSATLAGSIAATRLSANRTAGFSVVTYTGTGANATVGHGLGVAPSMIIVKARSVAAQSWVVYNSNFATPGTGYLYLDQTQGISTNASFWNSTAATSSVFSLGTNPQTNGLSTTYVAYCFAPISAYSSFGQYTGNSSADGVYVYTGFRPRWLLIKGLGSGGSGWMLLDTSRDTYNVSTSVLRPDLNAAASTGYGNVVDILSNGFKLRSTDTNSNSSSTTYGPYIYAAFAENPFKISRAR